MPVTWVMMEFSALRVARVNDSAQFFQCKMPDTPK